MIRKHLEQLEARENPATVALTGGTLTFTGDASADVVTLSVSGGADTLDLSSLSGYTDAPNYDGTGVVTLSNGKTITYSGIVIPVPINSVAPSCSPSSGTTTDSFVFSSGTWTGSPTSWSWEYRTAGSGSWTQFSTSQNPTISGSTFGTGSWDTRLTATNAGGSTTANGTTLTVTASGGTFDTSQAAGMRSSLSGLQSKLSGL